MAETKQAASLMSIEELKQKLGVSDAVFESTGYMSLSDITTYNVTCKF